MPRVLIVANRLPISVATGDDGGLVVEASPGGLASGLASVHARGDTLWIGWPGTAEPVDPDALERELRTRRLVGVPLSADEVQRYYDGFSNGVIWPMFHYHLERVSLEITGFDAYEAVNQRFADAVVSHYREGDVIWVHDYQLLLVPDLIRRRLPAARIGFFLHIPFPSSEVFRTLPDRERLLEGLLGADLVGFHTFAYGRHFATSVLRILGVQSEVDVIPWRSREVRMGVFPMGVDATALARASAHADVEEQTRKWRSDGTVRLLLGVDRLDYTKGILRRLLAFERLLERVPELREHVRLVQVAVPSREDVQAYQTFREHAEALIGRINGAFATPSWVPVHWMYRGVSHEELLALYRAADVMLVTPLRDGMNLVAKEFCAARVDDDGVLVLSEFAGAASELAEALMVNPFDVEQTAATYYRALTMPEDERRDRMHALRQRIATHDAERWATRFLDALDSITAGGHGCAPTAPDVLAALAARIRAAPTVRVVLDYDGTLVPFALSPELARPDAPLGTLLTELAARPGCEVHLVSGRGRDNLARWFGRLPIGLHAEHGLWSRPRSDIWVGGPTVDMSWRAAVDPILEDFTARTPGSLIEEKEASVAWHYRAADPEFGQRQARELHAHLTELLSSLPVRIVPGDRVIEIRPHGAHKGTVVATIRDAAPAGTLLVVLGDDHTDGDMFRAVGEDDIAIQVGSPGHGAPYCLTDVAAARAFLQDLLRE